MPNAQRNRKPPNGGKAERQARTAAAEADYLANLLAMGDLAGLLKQKGDREQAESTIRKALDIARRSPACGHPKMIGALIELADEVGKRGDLEASAALYREALQYCEWRRLPADNSLPSDARKKLAEAERKIQTRIEAKSN